MNKEYALDQIPGFPSTAKFIVDGATGSDILSAIVQDTPFPSGDLALGRISVDFAGKSDTPLELGDGEVTFKAAASGRLGIGICDTSAAVLENLKLAHAGQLSLGWTDDASRRFAYLISGYEAQASASGQHPIGAFGAATFGLDAAHASDFAVVRRFAADAGAGAVLGELLRNWRLPATIDSADDLLPGTTVLIEVDGSIGLKLGAQLGYDFSFVRAVEAGGISGDLGLKIAASLSTAVGASFSGRFILAVERPDEARTLRVRLFKLAKQGWTFALDLTVGASFVTPDLPDTADGFVEAVFGVHGQQAVKDLQKLEQWTDPEKSAGELVAGLTKATAFDLIERSTGIDPAARFEEARRLFLDRLEAWHELPATASAWLWETLQLDQSGSVQAQLVTAVEALTSPSDDQIRAFIAAQLKQAGFDQTPAGSLLNNLAEKGVLQLLDQVPEIRVTAELVKKLLDGGFLKKLQGRIDEALGLDQLEAVATATDWNKIDQWLLSRLGAFFGETLGFNRLDQVRGAIHAVLAKRESLYAAAREALARTYEAKFSYAYASATTRTALIDATFDFTSAAAGQAYRELVATGSWGETLFRAIEGVTLASGVLTHDINRKTDVQLTLPMLTANFSRVVASLAKLEVKSEGTELVGSYTLNASSEEKSIGRFVSRLSLAASFPAGTAGAEALRIHGQPKSSWTQLYRYAKADANFAHLHALLAPIQRSHFATAFSPPAESFVTWLFNLDGEVEKKLKNGPNRFGDVLVSFEYSMPNNVLAAWFVPRDKSARRHATCAASIALQVRLRELLIQSYSQDSDRLYASHGSLCALLVYSSLQAVNQVKIDGNRPVFSTDAPYWDWKDRELVEAVAYDAASVGRLAKHLEIIRGRLEAEGEFQRAADFGAHRVSRIIRDALDAKNYDYLEGLLMMESGLVRGTAKAIDTLADFSTKNSSSPAAALQALAEFGATITKTFNAIKTIYLPSSVRTIGSVLFCDVTQAINTTVAALPPSRALLAVTVLNPKRSFELPAFLDGDTPETSDIATQQRLTAGLDA